MLLFGWGKPHKKAHRHRRVRNSDFQACHQGVSLRAGSSAHMRLSSQVADLFLEPIDSQIPIPVVRFSAFRIRKFVVLMSCSRWGFSLLEKQKQLRIHQLWKSSFKNSPEAINCKQNTMFKPTHLHKLLLESHYLTKVVRAGCKWMYQENLQTKPEKVIPPKRALF